jgi:hypothetical protein
VTVPLADAPVPRQKPFLKPPWVWGVAAALVVGVGIGRAGGRGDEADSAAAAATPTSTVASSTAPTAPAPTTPAPTTTVPPPPVVPTPPPAPTSSPTSAGVDFAMASLVGLDLQSAQNTIQTFGVFFSVSHDLLGSRNQVLDSNWVVCTQNIAAGQRVTGDAEGQIDLGVVMREDSCP